MDCQEGPSHIVRALSNPLQPLISRKIILIATATIQQDSLFVNGLFQNIFLLYKLFDSIGYVPILLINDKPKEIQAVPAIMRHVRMMTVEEISRCPIPVHFYIEIGMSVDKSLRKIFRMGGAKFIKLYLGNILNIDIETPIFYNGMHFSHHIVGELDEIWVSPHYRQHHEYAAVLNQLNETNVKIAPYIWDPCVLTLNGARNPRWRPRLPSEQETLVILEPNISFQKCSLVPILIAERYYRTKQTALNVFVGNGEKLLANPFFTGTILPSLTLARDKRIIFSGRHSILSIMNEYPHATAICHQWNNQYNYMTLEYMYAGFPVIHNAADWHDGGYYYEKNSVVEGEKALTKAQFFHGISLEQYTAGAEAIRWRHSLYNPDVQKAWKELLV